MTMDIFEATHRYEEWLRSEVSVVEEDLDLKHQAMAKDSFAFLRGTFYRWMQIWYEVQKKAEKAPVVLSVGDLHVANFGTWRDLEERLVWGVNDVDEAFPLPYTLDLTRLAVSVRLASENNDLKIHPGAACEAIIEGYRESLETGGRPFLLDGENQWLRKAYIAGETSDEAFWQKLDALPDLRGAPPRQVRVGLEASLPSADLTYRVVHRRAGIGSLGRPRYTALANWRGERLAREAKALVAPAAAWAKGHLTGVELQCSTILALAVRARDPLLEVYGSWVVRRLAPDCRRIELSELGAARDEARMMCAMGWETGNIHLGTPHATKVILEDLKKRKKDWLDESAKPMAEATRADWKTWKAG